MYDSSGCLPISNVWLKKTQDATKSDRMLNTVKSFILNGPLENVNKFNLSVKQY